MDTQALISITSDSSLGTDESGENQSPIVFELLGARGDNNKARMGLSQSISLFGSASLSNMFGIATKGGKKAYSSGQAATTLDVFLLSAGLKSDIRDPSYLTKQGSKE